MTPRARFAPSPTGYLHVGSARTALFNWIFTRAVGGTFVLRIEDTDRTRNQPELIDNILDSLQWLGIEWDEGPHFQSQRADRHRDAVEQLLDAGWACRDDGAVRFRTPDEGTTGWDDVIRGRVDFDNVEIEDFVIQRSDGSAVFLLANAVDDLDMGITHVVRGEDLVNTVPKQLLLMRALGVEADLTYAHLPLLVDEQRRKLSKRFGDVAVESYRHRGIIAPAMTNYLATLGWGPGDDIEIRPMREIIELFDLADVRPSSAFFDVKKLTHFNAEYLRALSADEFVAAARAWFLEGYDAAFVETLQQRTHQLSDLLDLVRWGYGDETGYDHASWTKVMTTDTAGPMLDGTIEAFEGAEWTSDALHGALAAVGERLGLKLGKAQAPVRLAAMGHSVGPPLFESLEVLGRERTLARLRAARARLGG